MIEKSVSSGGVSASAFRWGLALLVFSQPRERQARAAMTAAKGARIRGGWMDGRKGGKGGTIGLRKGWCGGGVGRKEGRWGGGIGMGWDGWDEMGQVVCLNSPPCSILK